jgi:FMN-dependent NADH-azoreductase
MFCFLIDKINRLMAAMNLLQIKSSLFGDDGQSSRLANEFVAALLERNPGAELVVRDLVQDPVPHLDPARLGAFGAKENASAEQRAVLAYSDGLIAELRQADVLVLGLPMYNFGVPSQLKAWYDHVARAGVTFRYTDKGPQGLLTGRKAYIFAARGGEYAASGNDWLAGAVRARDAWLHRHHGRAVRVRRGPGDQPGAPRSGARGSARRASQARCRNPAGSLTLENAPHEIP